MDISLYKHVAKETDPHTLWKNLENMYETKHTSKDFLDAEANEFEDRGRPINCGAFE